MQVGVREAAEILGVSTKSVYRWIKAKDLPAYRVGDQLRFNRLELMEWATARRINVHQDLVLGGEARAAAPPSLSEALETGGIFYRVEGTDRATALRGVVDCLRLPEGTDRDDIYRILLAREELASTGIGEGIAIPHVRSPVVFPTETPSVGLCFLERPVEFGALDGKPVYALFTLICPTIKSHLQLLSQLGFVAHDPGFREALERRAGREEILAELRRAEAERTPSA